jgi:hypothetical protein
VVGLETAAVEGRSGGVAPSVKIESTAEASRRRTEALLKSVLGKWLDELDATAWGDKPPALGPVGDSLDDLQ